MSYKIINPVVQFNFQANRVMTYGSLACDSNEIETRVPQIRTFDEWYAVWLDMAQSAARRKKYMHAGYYYRMAEFFLKSDDSRKEVIYDKCIDNFYRGFDLELRLRYKKSYVPFEGEKLKCLEFSPLHSKGTIIVCGGYDSFIEEFVLQIRDFIDRNYKIILFEGPGQGDCLREKLYFRADFEKAASAVLDYFDIQCCAMIGISWGGYFALRSAACEKRISAVAAYDVMDNGFEVMTGVFPPLICKIIRFAYCRHWERLVNGIAGIIKRKSILADWALSQGMYITGTATPMHSIKTFPVMSFQELRIC